MHRLGKSAQSAGTPQSVARHGSAGKTISDSPEPRRGDIIQTAGRVAHISLRLENVGAQVESRRDMVYSFAIP